MGLHIRSQHTLLPVQGESTVVSQLWGFHAPPRLGDDGCPPTATDPPGSQHQEACCQNPVSGTADLWGTAGIESRAAGAESALGCSLSWAVTPAAESPIS